jgi:hypothetical protein
MFRRVFLKLIVALDVRRQQISANRPSPREVPFRAKKK